MASSATSSHASTHADVVVLGSGIAGMLVAEKLLAAGRRVVMVERALQGADFDTLWLQSMIAHHQGAIDMANTEIASGQNPDAVGVAKSIVASQQAQIDQMNQMLKGS